MRVRLRHRSIASAVGPTVAALALYESARIARAHEVSGAEERVFRQFNEAPDFIHPPVWALMQSGSLAAVFAVAGELFRRGRLRRAAVAAAAGTAVWAGVKLIKPHVGRGRPEHHLAGVSVRGEAQSGLGYPSGHAAVALTLAMIAPSSTGPVQRAAAFIFASVIGGTRMYVGAHLPVDVVGGLAIGTLAGRAARSTLDRCS